MKIKTFISIVYRTFLPMAVLSMALSSCNKEFPNILKSFSEQPNYSTGSSKVLYVIADGIRGKALQQLELPNLKIISRNALHSYGSLGDYEDIQFTKEIGLANLMTGVTSTKHKVVDNSLSQIDQTSYPSLLKRIKSEKNLHTAAFSTNEEFYNVVLKDADTGSLAISDADILTKTKEEISKGTSDLIVSHFSEPYIVGLQHSFEAEDQDYLEALRAFDTALGELIETIKQRPTYGQENWLVVITSSIGGPAENSQVDNTSYGDNERNTIIFFYNPKFSRSLLTRPNSTEIPYDGSAIRYTYGSPAVNATLQDASSFNFDTSDDFTIVFFFKSNITSSHNYPIILSKRDVGFSGNGWNLFLEVRDGDNKVGWNSNISSQVFGTKRVNDGEWHSIAVVVSRSGNADSVKMFTDGELNAFNTANQSSLANNAPLVIGKKAGDGNTSPDFLLSNLQIYNTAFSNKEVAELAGITHVDATHPKYTNLLGYWPGYEDAGTGKLSDMSGNNHHMVLSGPYNWVTFSDVVSYFQPPIRDSFYRMVPNAVDVPFFIYQWFGIIPKESWGLEGKSWTPTLLVSTY